MEWIELLKLDGRVDEKFPAIENGVKIKKGKIINISTIQLEDVCPFCI